MMSKKIVFVTCILALFLLTCEERETEEITTPAWIETRLTELENSGDCFGCTLQRWTYNNEYYYHLYCNHWSCSNCEVYRYNGDKVVWGENVDPADYEKNKHRPVKIWECGMEINAGT